MTWYLRETGATNMTLRLDINNVMDSNFSVKLVNRYFLVD